jgi:hypothetical protein
LSNYKWKRKQVNVVDLLHRSDACPDPDPAFHLMPIQILPKVLHILENQEKNLFTAVPVYIVARQHHRCHNFQYFRQYIEIFWKKVYW